MKIKWMTENFISKREKVPQDEGLKKKCSRSKMFLVNGK